VVGAATSERPRPSGRKTSLSHLDAAFEVAGIDPDED